jgi:hypothetical protein
VFFALPEALKQAQAGARQACYRHFKGSGVWDLSRPQEALRQRAQMLRATVAGGGADSALPSPSSKPLATPPSQQQQMQWMQQEQQEQRTPASPFHQLSPPRQEQAADGAPSAATNGSLQQKAEARWGPHLDAATLAGRFPPTLCLPPRAPLGRLPAALAAARERTGVTGEHLALALQLAVAMAAACTLHVTPASYAALHEKTIWVVVTGGCACCCWFSAACLASAPDTPAGCSS